MKNIVVSYYCYSCYLCLLFLVFSVNAEYMNATTIFEDYLINSGYDFLSKVSRGDIKNTNTNNKYRFISFDTKNDNIEVGFEFSVPFLSIPVQRSLQTVQSLATSAMNGPLTNVNIGAVALAGIMVGTGVATTYLWRTMFGFRNPTLIGYRSGARPTRTSNKEKDNDLWHLLEAIELALQKYGIDATACTQRTICSYVKSSSNNVARGIGSSSEKIIDGLTSSSWLLRMMSGSAIEDAIRAGRFAYDCESKYSGCKLKLDNLEELLYRIVTALSV